MKTELENLVIDFYALLSFHCNLTHDLWYSFYEVSSTWTIGILYIWNLESSSLVQNVSSSVDPTLSNYV